MEEIKAWRTEDGKVFDNEADAKSHESEIFLQKSFWDEFGSYGVQDFSGLIEWLKTNREEVINFLR